MQPSRQPLPSCRTRWSLMKPTPSLWRNWLSFCTDPMPHAKALRGAEGLRELRVKLASDIVRLFYFHHEGKVYIVTSGFVKKRDKTEPRELQRAIRLMRTFKEDAP